jgi:hypothetical protein
VKKMTVVGYAFLRDSLQLSALSPARSAYIGPVTRLQVIENRISVPRSVAPSDNDPLSHVLFALKHEGTNLQILAEAMPKIAPESLIAEHNKAPNGAYIRLACFLWESFTGKKLAPLPAIGGPTQLVFDPARYVTGAQVRNSRWRVAFNGIGSMQYCVTVERTPVVEAAIQSQVLDRIRQFIETLGAEMMDRAGLGLPA